MMNQVIRRAVAIQRRRDCGYTLVELLVALAVSAIVIGGTYAGYTFFARQQQILQAQTELDRSALRTIDLLAADIRMAGYKDYQSADAMSANQPIRILNTSPGDLVLVFDDYDQQGSLYRALVHYYLQSYTPAGGLARNRLMRDWRKCNNPGAFCDLNSSSNVMNATGGEPVLDWVQSFATQGLHQRSSGSFATQYQSVQVDLTLGNGRVIEGTNKTVSKSYVFTARARNVSLVP